MSNNNKISILSDTAFKHIFGEEGNKAFFEKYFGLCHSYFFLYFCGEHQKRNHMSTNAAIRYDIVQSIINTMFVTAARKYQECTDELEKSRLKESIDMYRWELNSLNSGDDNLCHSIEDKAINLYSPIIKNTNAEK